MPSRFERRNTRIDSLREQVWTLHCRWAHFRDLFSSPENIDLFNDCAPRLFADIKQALYVDIVLTACRLVDGSANTVSLVKIVAELKPELSPERNLTLSEALASAVAASVPLRTQRDEAFAHTAASPTMNVGPWIPPAGIQAFVDAVWKVSQLVECAAGRESVGPADIDCNNDATSFTRALRQGVASLRQQRIRGA